MQAAPTFPWDSYFAAIGAPELKDINVTAPKYLEAFTAAMASLPKDAWKSYLTYHVLADTAGLLPRRFVAEQFKRRQLVSGQPKIEDRWERCVGATVAALGELVAKPFLAEYYGPESEKATTDMVNGIRTAMRASLAALPWMDAKTRQRAFVKLDKMAFQMGAPKKWKTYDFAVSRKTYAANALASRRFEFQRDLDKIGKPVDRDEWRLPPSTVNAFYSANLNTMVFPAGILLPPFLNPKASTAVNLGAVGMVVGHELTHGFDDEGSQFDADGNLKSWWEASTRKEFDRRTKCVAEQ
jgi:predicted metalloendopeptidase